MRKVLRAKFSQHEDLKQLLLSTGNVRLVEAGRVDNAVNRTWGEVNGKGLNMLGVLLMELRAELAKEQTSRTTKANGASRRNGFHESAIRTPPKTLRRGSGSAIA